MFGGGAPDQVLHQLQRYHEEGRDELAEVMSSDLTEKLLMRKDRDEDDQQVLVKGLTILAQYLSQKYTISIGKFQMFVDCIVLILAIFIVDLHAIILSIVGAVSYNLILVINHKPGRYSAK